MPRPPSSQKAYVTVSTPNAPQALTQLLLPKCHHYVRRYPNLEMRKWRCGPRDRSRS